MDIDSKRYIDNGHFFMDNSGDVSYNWSEKYVV